MHESPCFFLVRDCATPVRPLEILTLAGDLGESVTISDSAGREYVHHAGPGPLRFQAAGAAGQHTITVSTGAETQSCQFTMEPVTRVEDAEGEYFDLVRILEKTMRVYGGVGKTTWNDQNYRYFVPWILDHCHTAKGMQYFESCAAEMVDLLGQAQREDGMIWSFAMQPKESSYYLTAYGKDGYAKVDGGALFVRQPPENHCEYNYVETMYGAWKASGDDTWMQRSLPSALRALDYTIHSNVRWSEKFQLLKRPYTIDSWDFQVEDEYLVPFEIAQRMHIDPERTKFGVFFGDNTGYAAACDEVAEMLEHLGQKEKALEYRERAAGIRTRLTDLTWNGRFFRHHVEEDPTVKRNLGANEENLLAMSNAYSTNRGISHEQSVAILRTYAELRQALPPGSPGEWYAIYPPYRGAKLGGDNQLWQYMNGGVHGHAAGELARGAFEAGFEKYGVDILRRIHALGRKHKEIIAFAYTGAFEPREPAVVTPMDLQMHANMNVTSPGSKGACPWMLEKEENDLRELPPGRLVSGGVDFDIIDRASNDGRVAVAIGRAESLPESVSIPIGRKAGALHVVHAAGRMGSSQIAAMLVLHYPDGSEHVVSIQQGKHLNSWWFPKITGKLAGVAWQGPNPHSTDVGVYRTQIQNPKPDEPIVSLELTAVRDGAIYALLALSLADRFVEPEADAISTGGPDNWSGALCAAAFFEGLAGVKDEAQAMRRVRLSPRWTAAGVKKVHVTTRYAASNGYVAYDFVHDDANRTIDLTVTGNGEHADVRVLLPDAAAGIERVTVDDVPVEAQMEYVEQSPYAVFGINPVPAKRVKLVYYSTGLSTGSGRSPVS